MDTSKDQQELEKLYQTGRGWITSRPEPFAAATLGAGGHKGAR